MFQLVWKLRVQCLLLTMFCLSIEVHADIYLNQEALKATLDNLRKAYQIPGMAVAVVVEDREPLLLSFGVENIETGTEVSPDTRFGIASVTKTFTAAGMMLLEQQGLLSIDDLIKDHIPGFAVDDAYISDHLTIRDALSHRSGLPRTMMIWRGSGFDLNHALAQMALVKPTGNFRQSFSYQNMLYNAMARIVQSRTGQPWSAFMDTRFFQPLTMESTSIINQHTDSSSLAAGHYFVNYKGGNLGVVSPTPVHASYLTGPSGGIVTSARDMVHWLRFQIDQGKINGEIYLEQGLLRETWVPHVSFKSDYYALMARDTSYLAYGLGWFMGEHTGRRMLWHGGNAEGPTSVIAILPTQKIGISVFANLDGTPGVYAAVAAIIDHLDQVSETDWNKAYRKYADTAESSADGYQEFADSRVADTRPSLGVDSYVGTYSHPVYGNIEIRNENGSLILHRGELVADLFHWHFDTFEARHRTGSTGFDTVTFILDASGQTSEMQMFDIGGFYRESAGHH